MAMYTCITKHKTLAKHLFAERLYFTCSYGLRVLSIKPAARNLLKITIVLFPDFHCYCRVQIC